MILRSKHFNYCIIDNLATKVIIQNPIVMKTVLCHESAIKNRSLLQYIEITMSKMENVNPTKCHCITFIVLSLVSIGSIAALIIATAMKPEVRQNAKQVVMTGVYL